MSDQTASKTIVITGASDGIGAAAARKLQRMNDKHTLVIVGRNPEKTRAVANEIGARYHLADFESLGQVRRLAAVLFGGGRRHLKGARPEGREEGGQVGVAPDVDHPAAHQRFSSPRSRRASESASKTILSISR